MVLSLQHRPSGKLQRLFTRALGLCLKYPEVPSGLHSLSSKTSHGSLLENTPFGLGWWEKHCCGPCLNRNAAEKPEMKIQAGSWNAVLDIVPSTWGQLGEIVANKTWSTVEKITSNKQWPRLFPEVFIGYFGTHHLSCLFSTASDYPLKVCFVHKSLHQSSSCSSRDFLPPLFSREFLSDSASSADYLPTSQLHFCHVTFYFSNMPRLALSHAVPVVITVSVVLSCKCWHLLLEAMLQFVRSLSNILLQNFFPLLNPKCYIS